MDVYTSFPWEALCAELAKLDTRTNRERTLQLQLDLAIQTEEPVKQNVLLQPLLQLPVGVSQVLDIAKE